jgi:2',3'-cyclic-nucleotide 2'-phosphodiesterase (5'-nucleotidase family)
VSSQLTPKSVRGRSSRHAIFGALGCALLLVSAAAPGAGLSPPRPAVDSLVILHTNDIHSHLLPFHRSEDVLVGGAAARAVRIERERQRTPDLLLLDAGDIVQGTPVYNLFRGVPETRAMSQMRYDAVALGNHDLDDGPAPWVALRRYAGYPVLSANVFAAADSSWAAGLVEDPPDQVRRGARWIGGKAVPTVAPLRFLAKPYVILPWRGKKIAVLGLTTERLVNIVRISANRGVAVSDPVAAARWYVPRLREKADYVIALTHLGVDDDLELARRVPGIDLIVGGHSHTRLDSARFAGTGTAPGLPGVPIVQTGAWGDRLGRSVLYLAGGRPAGFSYELLRVRPDEGEDPSIAALLRPVADSVTATMGATIYESEGRVPTPRREDVETAIGNFAAEVLREAAGADIGIMNTGGIRAPIPRGPVTVADIYSTFPFDNTIVIVPMLGSDVRRLLDFVARRIGKSDFAQVSGVRFTVSGDYATDIRVNGKRLDEDRVYRVATIDFLFEGGAGYTMFRAAGTVEPTGIFQHDAAVSYLRRHPRYEFRTDGRIVWEGSTKGLRMLQTR